MDIGSLFFTGHAGFYIKNNGYTIFIDPFRIGPAVKEKADLVLITHAHFDHCNKDDMRKVLKPEAEVICSQGCGEMADLRNFTLSKPGFSTKFKDASVTAVPAYNVKPERLNFHPKANNWVGYVIEINGFRIYHAGDTDLIDEMKHLKEIDAALLPMGGTYVMSPEEAAAAANAIKPKFAVPIHYKNLLGRDGSKAAEELFRSKAPSAHIMKEVQEPTYGF